MSGLARSIVPASHRIVLALAWLFCQAVKYRVVSSRVPSFLPFVLSSLGPVSVEPIVHIPERLRLANLAIDEQPFQSNALHGHCHRAGSEKKSKL